MKRESPDGLMNVEEAGTYLGLAIETLYSYRHKKKGPKIVRRGSRIFYKKEDLDNYLNGEKINFQEEDGFREIVKEVVLEVLNEMNIRGVPVYGK